MKKCLILLVGTVLYSVSLINAQTGAKPGKDVKDLYTIGGQVVDSVADESVPYATVSIAAAQMPKQVVKAAACDGSGKFELQLKDPGNYVMTIQSVGKTTVVKPFTLSDGDKKVNFGKLTIQDDVRKINEVTVMAQKPLVRVEIDKVIYSMEDDPEAKVNNVLEMLRKVPLVTVDGEDNVQLKGSSNFKIYLNGKPSNMFNGQNTSNVLKSMPASSVKNIEVITDPGVKYDAEGIGGIINIVTARNAFQGYSGTLSANAGTFGTYGGGAYLTTKQGKFGLTGNFNYNNFRRPWGESENTAENFVNDSYRKETTTGRNKNQGNYLFGNVEASYEMDTLNLLSVGVNLWSGRYKTTFERETEMLNNLGELAYGYDRDGNGRFNYGSTGVNVDYQRSMRKKGEYFTVSYRFNNSPDGSEDWSYMSNIDGTLPPHLKLNQRNENDAKTREHTGQLDYVNPITKKHTVEAGVKYILRQNLSDVKQYGLDAESHDWTLLPANANSDFNHSSQIYAGYLGYSFKTEKIGLKTGIRAEGTQQSVKYRLNEAMNFGTDYFNAVPSLTVSYQLKKTQQIRLGYNLRIYRPGIWYLNPYVNDTDPFNISYGNPKLDAEKSNNINLNYSFFSPKLTLNISASYAYVNNSIQSYTKISDLDPRVKERTYDNIGRNQRTAFYANAGWTPNKVLRINFNGGLNYTDMQSSELGRSNSGLNGNFYTTVQVSLPKDFRINANGMYYSGWMSLQGKSSAQYHTSISVNKDFLKKKLTVSLSCSNPFNNTLKYKNTLSDPYFSTSSTMWMKAREGRINISYRFGTMKETIKKVQRGISNDDVKSGGGGGGGTEGGGGGGM